MILCTMPINENPNDNKEHEEVVRQKIEKEALFLIAKFLHSIEPLEDIANQLIQHLEEGGDRSPGNIYKDSVIGFPERVDWKGSVTHMRWDESIDRYNHISDDHLIRLLMDWIKSNNLLIASNNLHGNFMPFLSSCIEANDSLKKLVTHSFFGTRSSRAQVVSVHDILKFQELGMELLSPYRYLDVISRLGSYEEVISVQGHSSPAYCAIFDKKEQVFVTGGDDGRIKTWCVLTGRLINSFRGHTDCITDLTITPDNRLLISASNDSTIRLWDISDGKCLCVLRDLASVCTVDCHPLYDQGVPLLLSSTTSGLLRIWKIKESKHGIFSASSMLLSCKSVSKDQIHCLGFTPGATKIVAGGTDGIVRIFKTPSIKDPSFIELSDDCLSFISDDDSAPSPRTSTLSMTLRSGTSSYTSDVEHREVSDAQTRSRSGTDSAALRKRLKDESDKNAINHLLHYFDDHNGAISTFDYSLGGTGYVSGAWDGTARIRTFDRDSRKYITESILRFQDGVIPPPKATATIWTKDDRYIVTASTDHVVNVWSTKDGKLLRSMREHTGDVYVLVCHPKYPNIILSAGCDGKAIIYDAHVGDILFLYEYTGRSFLDGQFSPSGTFFILSDVIGTCTLFALAGCFVPSLYLKTPKEQFFPVDFRDVFLDDRFFAVDEITHNPPFLEPRSPTLDSSHIPNPCTYPLDYGLDFDFSIDPLERSHSIVSVYSAQRKEQHLFAMEDHFFLSGKDLPKRKFHTKGQAYFYGDEAIIPHQEQPRLEPPREATEQVRSRREREEAFLRAMMEEDEADEPYVEESEESEQIEDEQLVSEEEDEYSLPRRSRRTRIQRPARTKRHSRKKSRKRRLSARWEGKRQVKEISYLPPEWTKDAQRRRSLYIPQLHDQVAYFVQGHELFIEKLRQRKRHLGMSIGPFLQDLPWKLFPSLPFVLKCTVESIKYHIGPPMWCELKLKTDFPLDTLSSEDASTSRSKRRVDTFITINYIINMDGVPEFLILWGLYEWSISCDLGAGKLVSIVKTGYHEETDLLMAKILETDVHSDERYPNSTWKSIRVELIPNEITLRSGRRIRRAASRVDEFINDRDYSGHDESDDEKEGEICTFCSPWEFYEQPESTNEESIFIDNEEIPIHIRMALLEGFEVSIMGLETAEPFKEPVDLDAYPDYCLLVPYPVDLGLIVKRVESNYYRRLDAINTDIDLIRINAAMYNEPNTEYPKMARKLISDIQRMIPRIASNARLVHYRRQIVSDDEENTGSVGQIADSSGSEDSIPVKRIRTASRRQSDRLASMTTKSHIADEDSDYETGSSRSIHGMVLRSKKH